MRRAKTPNPTASWEKKGKNLAHRFVTYPRGESRARNAGKGRVATVKNDFHDAFLSPSLSLFLLAVDLVANRRLAEDGR